MTFSDFRRKEVINVCDGRRLGCVCDMIVDVSSCRISAIVVPGAFSFRGFFSKQKHLVIPWDKIRKLGDDVILVDAGEPCGR